MDISFKYGLKSTMPLGLDGEPLYTIDTTELFMGMSGANTLIGPLGSGGVISGMLGSGVVISGSIASGAIGHFHLSSGIINSGNFASGAILPSGSIITASLASGAAITTTSFVSPFYSGTNWQIQSEESISPFSAVAISPNGFLRVAMASISGRMPAVGVLILSGDGVAPSGINANVYTVGSFASPISLVTFAPLWDFSGYIGQPVYVGRSGAVVTLSGALNSGGFLSGDILQQIGIVQNSGGAVIGVNAPYVSGGPVALNSGDVGSGKVASGTVQGFFGTTRHITSGTIGVWDFGSGAIIAGSIGSGTVISGNIASGVIGRFHHASGQLAGFELGSGAIVSGRIASGQIGLGHYADSSIQSGAIGSGQIASGHLASGLIANLIGGIIDAGLCEVRIGLNSEISVHGSGDIISVTTSSGRLTSGSAIVFLYSGLVSGLCPGMLLVTSGTIPNTTITYISGLGGSCITLNNAATQSTSGASFQFIPGVLYAVGHVGNRISLYDGTNWTIYRFTSGTNSSLKLYDNQSGIILNGDSSISGLTDTFQLVPGMQAVASGWISSGTVITFISGATSVTLSANAISGGSGTSIIFMIPPNSGGATSGGNWDVFATLRSGIPWLQWGNQWTQQGGQSGNRLDPLFQQEGVWSNSGVIN